METKSPKLTDEQNDLCYEIQLAMIKGVVNLSHDAMWKSIEKIMAKDYEGKINKALADIQTNIDSMKLHSKEHEKDIRKNGEAIASGLEMAREILKKHFEIKNEE